MKRILVLAAGLLLASSTAFAQLGATSPTGTLSVSVGAEAGLVVNTSVTTLATVGTNFSPYTGTTNLTYYIRTSSTGSIVLEVTTDFHGTGGPSVGTPPTSGDALTYTCSMNAPMVACSGMQTASTGTTTSVASVTGASHSALAGNTGSVAWSLTNDPVYAIGTYSATITYTISAT
jgi:hypothetical protein